MAITAQEARVVHVGNGVTTFFSYAPIEGVTAANLKVWLYDPTTGVLAPQTLTTHYTFGSGGVTFLTAPATGVRVILRREVPFIQPDVYTTNTPFPAKVTENRLDQIVMAAQELRDDILTRAIRLPLGEAGFSQNVLPAVEARKGRLLGFDTAGDPVVYDIPETTTPITPWAKNWLSTSTSAASGRANLGATTVGDDLFTAASPATARAILEATAVGDDLFTAPSKAAARAAIDAAASGAVGASGLTMDHNRLLGRWSSGSGPIQEVTIGPGLTLSSSGVLDAVAAGANFLALTDTPSTYTGMAERPVFVNSAADGLEFPTPATARTRLDVPQTSAVVLRDGSQAMTGRLNLAAGAAGGLAFAGDTDTGVVQTANDVVELRTGGDPRLTATNSGLQAHVPLTVPAATAAGHAPRWEQARLSSSGLVSLSGTATDITNIPDDVREVSIWLRNASLSVDAALFLIQAGSDTTPMTTGYTSVGHIVVSTGEVATSTSGIVLMRGSAVRVYTCQVVLQRIGSSGDWVGAVGGGTVQTAPLSGSLSQCGGFTYFTLAQINMIRITSSTGTATLSGNAMVSWRF